MSSNHSQQLSSIFCSDLDNDNSLTSVDVSINGLYHLPKIITTTNLRPLIDKIMQHNKNKDVSYIQLNCDSFGGSLLASFAFIDIMELSRIPIYTIGSGMVASAATLIFISGHKDHRVSLPRAYYMTHMFSGEIHGRFKDIINVQSLYSQYHEALIDIFVNRTKVNNRKKAEKFFMDDIDKYFGAKDAVKYGIADKIATSLE